MATKIHWSHWPFMNSKTHGLFDTCTKYIKVYTILYFEVESPIYHYFYLKYMFLKRSSQILRLHRNREHTPTHPGGECIIANTPRPLLLWKLNECGVDTTREKFSLSWEHSSQKCLLFPTSAVDSDVYIIYCHSVVGKYLLLCFVWYNAADIVCNSAYCTVTIFSNVS